MNKFLLLILIFLLSGIAAFPQAKNIFVSPSGDDHNKGLSANNPVKTIAQAVAAALPGDTIYLMPGIYSGPVKLEGKKGLPEKPVYLYGYGQASVIDGGAIKPKLIATNYWIILRNCEWMEIGNLSFQNGWTDPVMVDNSSYISFKNCHFTGGRRVIAARNNLTHHLLIENCSWDQGGEQLWQLKDSGGIDAWTSMHHGDLAYYNGTLVDCKGTSGSIVIRNNTIKNAFNGIRLDAVEGHDTNVEITGNSVSNIRDNDFEPEKYTYNLYIHHNRSHNIHKTMSVDNVTGGYIYYFGNQVTSDTSAWAQEISTGLWKVYGAERVLSYPMYAFNNSFYGNHRAFSSMGGKASLFKHFNNAYFFSGSRTWELSQWDTTDEFDYDISNKPWASNIIDHHQEPHGKIADVKYHSPKAADLKIRSNSPAVDAGKIMVLPELNWKQSYKGKAPDIGAFEGDQLTDGPAFQFRNPPNITLPYIERPRIVKYETANNKLIIYFSTAINPLTISAASIILKENGLIVPVKNIHFPGKLQLVITTSKQLTKNQIALNFRKLPQSVDGQPVTCWASAIHIATIK